MRRVGSLLFPRVPRGRQSDFVSSIAPGLLLLPAASTLNSTSTPSSSSAAQRLSAANYPIWSSSVRTMRRGCEWPSLQSQLLLGAAASSLGSMHQVRFASTAASNPYKVLGVKPGASVVEIKKAHRVLTRKFHPDVPGGSKEKFQEVQDAYEQLKTGVWVKKGGTDQSDPNRPQNRYANFRFTQGGGNRKVSYQDVYTTMHTNRKKGDDMDDEDEAAASADPRKNPFGPNSVLFQAWFRLIAVWSVAFVILRIALFLTFPPKHERPQKRQMSDRPKKPPPPKPLAPSTAVLG